MANFDIAYRLTNSHEGYYTTTPNETYMGIDRKWHSGWDGWPLIDRFKETNALRYNQNLSTLSNLHQRHAIYSKTIFWDKLLLDSVTHQNLANVWYDTYFTLTNKDVVRAVQRIAGTDADGIVGPLTLAAVNKLDSSGVDAAITALNSYRLKTWRSASNYKTNAKGWESRVASYEPSIASNTPTSVFNSDPASSAITSARFERPFSSKIYSVAKIAIPSAFIIALIYYSYKQQTKPITS